MKRLSVVILAAVLILCLATGCGRQKETILPVHVAGSIFGGGGTDSIGLELKFDPDWITKADNTVYNGELAAFSALISADTYFRTKDLDRGTPNRVTVDGADTDAYDQTVLLSTLGFTDVQYIESFKAAAYEADQNDSVTLTMGYLNSGDKFDCFVIGIRGCFSSGEWNSIFDVGSNGGTYTELTGEHPEWTDPDLMKGIGVASGRAMSFISEFITAHDDPSRKNCVLVTGHSRGGAIAQIAGARLEDDSTVKSFTYTFNSSPVTDNESAENYKTIFNIFDSADFFSDCFPFANEKFYRYGKTLSVDAAENSEILNKIAAVKGTDDYRCLSDDGALEYTEMFGRLFEDRASLYERREIIRSFADEASAEAARAECSALTGSETGLGLELLCSLSEIEKNEDGEFEFRIVYCRGALAQCIGRVLAYGQSACDAVKFLFAEQEDICGIADLIMANAADITGGHRLLNSYVLTGYLKE